MFHEPTELLWIGCLIGINSSSRKWPWREFQRCKEFFLVFSRTTFRWNRKVDQWSDRDHWSQPDWLWRFKVDIDKLVAQSSLSIRQCQRQRLFRLGAVFGEKWDNPVESWKKQIHWYSETNYFSDLNRILGKPMEFEWKIFSGHKTAGILNEIQKNDGRITVWSSRSKAGSSSCQCSTTLNGVRKEIKNDVRIIQKRVEEYDRKFLRGHWSFLGPGSEKKWYATQNCKPNRSWDRTAEKMLQNFQRSGHPIFHSTIALVRGHLRSKGTLHSMRWECLVAPQDDHICQSAQSLRSSSGFD